MPLTCRGLGTGKAWVESTRRGRKVAAMEKCIVGRVN